MKPARFEYYDPESLDEAMALLEQQSEEAKVLAGGQSLMPLMNMRIARPAVIVDINRIRKLAHITPALDGGLAVGALTRHRAVERSPLVQERNPLLAAAIPYIGHFQIRNRGTIGGSVVHADPAAELPAVCVALEAELVLESSGNSRVLRAEDFFVSDYSTNIQPTELLTELRIPPWPPGSGWGFDEVCRRAGDFAVVGVAALIRLDGSDLCQGIRIALFGVGGTPVRMRKAEGALLGIRVDEQALQETERIVAENMKPESDIHASAQYRKEVAGVLARRTLAQAVARAKESRAA